MANRISKLAGKSTFFLMLGVSMLLLAGESTGVFSSPLLSQLTRQADRSDERISQQTPFIVGEVEQHTARIDYLRQANKGQTITYPGASFIKVHFLTLDLLPGDYVTVSDPTGAEKYTYPGSASTSDSEAGFWSMSITGDTAVVQLHTRFSSRQLSESAVSKSGFIVDKYGRGYPQEEIERILTRSTCGTNQRRDVACYQGTNPTEFDKSNAVARLLIYYPDGFYAFCTAWRAGVGASMLTNQHCLDSQTKAAASEAWFNYQNQTCDGSDLGTVTKVAGNKLLTSDLVLDFALFTVNNPESIANFGYLDIDARTPVLGEQIYIPQHGGGSPKQFGIESDRNTENVCRIDAAVIDGLDNGTDTGYYCDTTGGSSGSPVLASSSNQVIAIHHFGNSSAPTCTTPNQGVRMDLIWPRVEPYLLQVSPFGSIGSSQPTYTWKEISSATWYYLWVNGPSGNVIKQWYQASNVCSAGVCSASPDVTLVGGAHQWWVQTWSPEGYGPWSSGLSFSPPVITIPSAPILISPSDSTTDYNPTYTWNEVLDEGTEESAATWYYLWVNGPSGNVIKQWYQASAICSAGVCSATPTTNLSAGNYTFWVQGWNVGGYGPWSSGLNFSVSLPGSTLLITPSGDIETNTPTYTWNEVTDVTWYYLWVNGPSGNVVKQWYDASAVCSGGTCTVTPATTLASGAHTWWIRTWNNAGYGPWSDGMNFTVSP